jgi:hypothetical protein
MEALFVQVDKRVLRRLVPLAQQDLAEMAGTTRPTANRVLHDAEQAGLIRVGRGRHRDPRAGQAPAPGSLRAGAIAPALGVGSVRDGG